MKRAAIFAVVVSICIPGAAPAAEAAPAPKLELKPCTTIPGLPPGARCGIYEVFENRTAKSGRPIPLQVVVLPATGPKRLPDPLVYFAGGPGGSSINEGAGFSKRTPELRKSRDILLIDSRGTGKSAALSCDELMGTGSLQGFLEDFLPADKVRACRDRLRKNADLSQYSTDNVVDDVEEIRTALGYGQVNVYGTSYGTRAVQVYMRRHPGSVRTAAMSGVLPVGESGPLVTARYSQQALDRLVTECESDPDCAKAFPKLREEVAAVLRQVAKEPLRLQVPDPETGQPIDFTLSKNGFGQVLRRMLYYNDWISLTPLYLHLAANGDWQPLAEFALVISQMQSSVGGYFLSITCSEDLAFVHGEEIPAAVAGTFLGDLRVRKQLVACAGWPAPKLGPEFRLPVTSDIPTLLLSGAADPVTPPSSGEQVARALPRSRHVVVEDGGHGLAHMKGQECVPQMISELIAEGAIESLDTSCAARMQRPGFLLSLDPEVKLEPEQLQRLAGSWVGKDGADIRTEVVGGYLRVVFPYGPTLLAATSPTRFRLRNGEPGFALTFGPQDGRAVSMTLEEFGETSHLTRKASSSSTAASAPKLELKPCTTIAGLPPEARCGVYEVWENRAAKAGRKIPLRVAVLPATGPDRQPDPLVYFEGGPGDSAIGSGSWLAEDLGELRKKRDILLVDLRGTGESGGLFCPELQGMASFQGILDDYLPADKVKACAERLGQTADLTQYTNDNCADDVDEVRAALGYGKVNLYGVSGGSRTALVYLRRHPETVRTVAIAAVNPPDERGPFQMARHVQRALDGLIAECEADAGCRAAFPGLRGQIPALLRQVDKQPVTVEVMDQETGRPVAVRLGRNALAQTLRYMLYSPAKAANLPLNVHLAAQGDWAPLAEIGRTSTGALGFARGYYLSLTCAEDVAFIREDEIAAAVHGTFLGDLRIRKQQEACAAWPTAKLGRDFLQPVTSDVPVLLVSGERDPATPPSTGERAARTLKNSLHIVVPDAGHSYSGLREASECVDRLITRLVGTGTVQGLDASCLERTKRPDFALRRAS